MSNKGLETVLSETPIVPVADACPIENRRVSKDRRSTTFGSLAYGSVNPRRRQHRREVDTVGGYVDWLDSELLYLALGILVLSTADAILTLNLLKMGAQEVNLLMAKLIARDEHLFAAIKMALTGTGIVLLVAHARFRLFKVLRVHNVLRGVFFAYLCLIIYELILINMV